MNLIWNSNTNVLHIGATELRGHALHQEAIEALDMLALPGGDLLYIRGGGAGLDVMLYALEPLYKHLAVWSEDVKGYVLEITDGVGAILPEPVGATPC